MPPIGFSCALKGEHCQHRGPAAALALMIIATATQSARAKQLGHVRLVIRRDQDTIRSREATWPRAHTLIRTRPLSPARSPDWPARRQRRPRAHLGVDVRINGLTRMFRGSSASSTPRLAPNPPQCRPIQPKRPIFSCFQPMGLHFGSHTAPNRDLTTLNRDLTTPNRDLLGSSGGCNGSWWGVLQH